MKIENHALIGDQVSFQQTPNFYNGPFRTATGLADSVIVHYTAMTSLPLAVKALTTRKARGNASAHLVVGKNGEVVQLAKFNFRTWHAGDSEYNGRKGYNSYAIGIEIDNVGWLQKMADGTYGRQELQQTYTEDEVMNLRHFNPNVHYQYWQKYTNKQVATVTAICELLKETYDIKEILGHDEIAPARKQDPGPAFDMLHLRNTVLNDRSDHLDVGKVSASLLNIRAGAGVNFEKVAQPLKRNTEVQVLEEQSGWYKVRTSIEGWVSKDFIDFSE